MRSLELHWQLGSGFAMPVGSELQKPKGDTGALLLLPAGWNLYFNAPNLLLLLAGAGYIATFKFLQLCGSWKEPFSIDYVLELTVS